MPSDDDLAEAWFAGKVPAIDDELEELRQAGQRVALCANLRYIAAENGWKPGWAAHFYKAMHGEWPDREWEKVPPIRPEEEVYQMVTRRQSSYRREMREFFAERRAEDERRLEDGEATDVVCEGD